MEDSQAIKNSSAPKSVSPVIYDVFGNPVRMGNTDPNVIGPDDHAEFQYRDPNAYPDVPEQVKNAEVRFILPVAKFIAGSLGVTVLDEGAYEKVLTALKTRSLFVVLNLYKTKVVDGVASWYGLILMCKRHPVVMVQFKMRLATEQIGVSLVKLWDKANERYVLHGDREGRKLMTREEVSAMVMDYLNREGVVPGV